MSQPIKPTRGGARPNSGRKPTGKVVLQTTITLHPALMERMDALRGPISRSSWIASKIKSTRKTK